MTVDLSSPELKMGGEDEAREVRGMRREPNPDRQRGNKYIK